MKRFSLLLLALSALATQAQVHLSKTIEHWVQQHPEVVTYSTQQSGTPNEKNKDDYTFARYEFELKGRQTSLFKMLEKAYQKEAQRTPLPARSLLVQRGQHQSVQNNRRFHSIAYAQSEKPLLVGGKSGLMLVRGASPKRESHDLFAIVDYARREAGITGSLYIIERPKELGQASSRVKESSSSRAPLVFVKSKKGDFEIDMGTEEGRQQMKKFAPEDIESISVFKNPDLLTRQPKNVEEYAERLDFYLNQLEQGKWSDFMAKSAAKYGEYFFSKQQEEEWKRTQERVSQLYKELNKKDWKEKGELPGMEALQLFSAKMAALTAESNSSMYGTAREDFRLLAPVTGSLALLYDGKEDTLQYVRSQGNLEVDFHEEQAQTLTRWRVPKQGALKQFSFSFLTAPILEMTYGKTTFFLKEQPLQLGVTTRFVNHRGKELFLLTFDRDLTLLAKGGGREKLLVRAGSYLFFETAARS